MYLLINYYIILNLKLFLIFLADYKNDIYSVYLLVVIQY